MQSGRVIDSAVVFAVLALGLSGGVLILWLRDASIVQENHLVEWSQVAFLLAATAIHTWRSRQPGWRGERIFRLALALLCVSFAVREVDIDRLGEAAIMSSVETAVRLALIAAWLIVAWRTRLVLDAWWNRKFDIVLSGLGMFTFAGCALYAASWPFDKFTEHLGGNALTKLFEETIQLNATMLLFLAAWFPPLRRYESDKPRAS